ncbi:tail fiber protein [Xenorhabdus sp. Flor]|uniref:phage tail protein n=1 Tax=Xenorhabdus cabanillasii TaxID=351673 RepID=UPI00199F25C8|nr:phage tail protein [Xenorhabdus sp. Flor]MBD2813659.1 tail fiber protein [Xenorhabdus sp. Flor]
MSIQDNKSELKSLDDSDLVVVSTPEYVKNSIKESIEEHAKSRNHPYATQVEPGFVTLSNDVDSTSEMTVATSKAVKAVYDLATANQNAINSHIGDSGLPVGVPVPWPTEIPPEGWLICNGDSFDKAKYPKLALAYPSGRLPDLRGEFIRGLDNGRGIDYNRQILSWQADTFARHNHSIRTTNSRSTSKDNADPVRGEIPGSVNSLGSTGEGKSIGMTGGNETRPRNIAFNYIVRAA